LASAVDNGCHFGHHCQQLAGDFVKNTEADRKKKFSFILRVTTVFFLAAASANPLDGVPTHWIVLIYQIHAA
jgi:hypothetical protein